MANKWDRDEYIRQMTLVRKAVNAYSEWIDTELGSVNMDSLIAWYDGKSREQNLKYAIIGFKNITTRLEDLRKAMVEYLEDYDAMLARANNNMENVEEVDSVYGTFRDIVTGIRETTKAALATSLVYKFYQSGKTFSGDYNDMTSFIASDLYKDEMKWMGWTKVDDYELYFQSLFNGLMGEDVAYVDERLQNSLKKVVESIPGTEPVGLNNVDWDAIGKKLGIENLAEYMGPIDALLKQLSDGNLSDEKMGELKTRVEVAIQELARKGQKGSKVVTMLESFSKFLGKAEAGAKLVNFGGDMLANYFNTYADQISYLESMKAGMEAAGYWTGSPVMEGINEIQRLYEDRVAKSFVEAMGALEELSGEAARKVVQEVPFIGGIDKGLEIISNSAEVVIGKDTSDALEDIMGYYQFDNVLTQSYERYADLVESGLATEKEMQEAEKLFEMVHTMKIKEYEAIQTIAKDRDAYWYRIATDKLKELREFNK